MTSPKTFKRPKCKAGVAIAASAVLAGTALTACGSSSTSPSSAPKPHQTTSNGATTTQLAIEGGSSPMTVLNLNPYNGAIGVLLMYNSLELVDPVNGSMSPELATAFKAVSPTTLVFTIRKGVQWSNKTPFTPADVVFTFDMLKKYPALDTSGVWSELTSVTASGDNVTFGLRSPDVPLGLTLASVPIVSQAVWSKVADPVKYTAAKPVVTGPYTLDSFAPTKLVLKKNPLSFEASRVKPQTVALLAGPSSQVTNDLLVARGTYDFAYAYVPDVQKTFVSRDPAHNVYWFPPGGVVALYMNLTEAPFDSAAFRRGVSYAIDRQAVENKAVFGVEQVAPQTGLILPGEKSWEDPNIPGQGLIVKNDKKALSLFGQAGYHLSGGRLLGPGGKQVSFSITVPNSYSDWIGAAQQIATNLGQVGIKASLVEPTPTTYQNVTYAGEFEAAIGSFGGGGSAYSSYDPALNSAFAAPLKTATTENWERFKSAVADKDLAALAAATTPAASIKATYPLEELMYKSVPLVDLYYGGMWGLFSTRHWVGWPSAKDPYTLPATWDSDLLAIVMHVRPA